MAPVTECCFPASLCSRAFPELRQGAADGNDIHRRCCRQVSGSPSRFPLRSVACCSVGHGFFPLSIWLLRAYTTSAGCQTTRRARLMAVRRSAGAVRTVSRIRQPCSPCPLPCPRSVSCAPTSTPRTAATTRRCASGGSCSWYARTLHLYRLLRYFHDETLNDLLLPPLHSLTLRPASRPPRPPQTAKQRLLPAAPDLVARVNLLLVRQNTRELLPPLSATAPPPTRGPASSLPTPSAQKPAPRAARRPFSAPERQPTASRSAPPPLAPQAVCSLIVARVPAEKLKLALSSSTAFPVRAADGGADVLLSLAQQARAGSLRARLTAESDCPFGSRHANMISSDMTKAPNPQTLVSCLSPPRGRRRRTSLLSAACTRGSRPSWRRSSATQQPRERRELLTMLRPATSCPVTSIPTA